MISLSFKKELEAANGKMTLAVDMEIPKGQYMTLFGPSGAGKTSLLQIISGLMKPDAGYIRIGDEIWSDTNQKIFKKVRHRSIGYLFQEYALFPNMTVEQNLSFALPKNENPSIIEELLKTIDLVNLRKRNTNSLSGGQKQRVALARALVRKPQVLLLDEPLSALDFEMRSQMQNYLKEVHHRYNLTTIHVTHDVGEIFKLANRVIKLENGAILADGNPIDIFTRDNLSAKFRFKGTVLSLEKSGLVHIVLVQVENQLIRVIATEEDIIDIAIGDQVLLASKAFNPIIRKIQI